MLVVDVVIALPEVVGCCCMDCYSTVVRHSENSRNTDFLNSHWLGAVVEDGFGYLQLVVAIHIVVRQPTVAVHKVVVAPFEDSMVVHRWSFGDSIQNLVVVVVGGGEFD